MHIIDRELGSEDRRIVQVRLSGQGQKTLAAVKEVLQHFFEQALSDITDEERVVILHSFESVSRAIAKSLTSCRGQSIPSK